MCVFVYVWCVCVRAELNFEPGENVVEVYVVEALIDAAVLGASDTTFAMVDFYDFESQTSPFAIGSC
jgi:hypothetical protein